MKVTKSIKRTLILIGYMVFFLSSCQNAPGQENNGKYGLNTYNTLEVVAELQYIEKNVKQLSPKPKARILITGSTAGVGELTAKTLVAKGYKVVVHARNQKRAGDVKKDIPEVEAVVIGDLSDLNAVRKLAEDINALGTFDIIIYNAGIYQAQTKDDTVLKVNSLAPYILTSLINKPKQIIYVSSELNRQGKLGLEGMLAKNPNINYPDSKLQILTFSKAVARIWKDVRVAAITPGWVPTKMGGSNSPDNLRLGYSTLIWLVEGKDKAAQTTGQYFFQSRIEPDYNKISDDPVAQNALLDAYFKLTKVPFPKN